jgi:hypothetical protein
LKTIGQKSALTRSQTKTPHKSGENPFVRMLSSIRTNRSVRVRKLELRIDYLYVKKLWDDQEGRCSLTNIPMLQKHGTPYSMSIDRIDNSIGYIKGNVRLVCKQINLMKSTMNDLEFKEFCHTLILNLKTTGI